MTVSDHRITEAHYEQCIGKLNLPEELVLLLLNEESGYFHQVPGWNLHCAIVGAVLAELALGSRIDTDSESLFLIDPTETGDSLIDPILSEIASEPTTRNPQFWIERLTPQAESIIDLTLDRLEDRGVLDHHSGGFWSLSQRCRHATKHTFLHEGTAVGFVKTRISRVIFDDEIPDPRDVILICLVNTCDVFRFVFPLDEASRNRLQLLSRMDVIGRSIAAAISGSIEGPALRRPVMTKPIPIVPLGDVLLNRHLRSGNLPAVFADLYSKHGPVFEVRPPFVKKGLTFLAGTSINRWLHRSGRMYLRSKDYLEDFEKAYGASRILPAMDGADHFRMRKAMSAAYARSSLAGRLDEVYRHAKTFMTNWSVGDVLLAVKEFQRMMNAQFSPLSVGIDTQDCIDDLLEFKQRSLTTHVQRALPKFMLNTPGMKRRKKRIGELLERIQAVHTTAQRVGCPRDVVDDLLSLHKSDPQFLPETDLRFGLVSPIIVSVYLGNAMSFAVYSLVKQPALYERVRAEADALFADGDPSSEDLTEAAIDVTHRFLMESQRLYPVLPMQVRTVMNTCVVEGYELPIETRVYFATTAAHYSDEVFPEPFSFDIDRYLPPREEHKSGGYAPFGLGTHKCLGFRWVELHMAINLLMLAYYFRFELSKPDYELRINPFPTLAPTKKLKVVIAEQRHEIRA